MRHIHTEIEIDASPRRVWDALTDFAGYADWNPLIREASGRLEEGARLRLRIVSPGLLERVGTARLLAVRPERELRWLGRWLCRGVLDGDHAFILDAGRNGSVRLIQTETFSGALLPLVAGRLLPAMRQSFEAMNAALKHRLEGPNKEASHAIPDSAHSPDVRPGALPHRA